jgi:hypothetical protein
MSSIAPVVRHWNTLEDAVNEWYPFEMANRNVLSKGGSGYLKSRAQHLAWNPPLPAPFVFSVNALPYAAQNQGNKTLFMTESTAYARDLKVITDKRDRHSIKSQEAIGALESSFSDTCVARKGLLTIQKRLEIGPAVIDPGEIYLQMMEYLTLHFAPTKATDSEALINKLATADFHDGRGLEIGAMEFIETYEHLDAMHFAPVPQVMQKYLAGALNGYSTFSSRIQELINLTAMDAAAVPVVIPLIPRWKAVLSMIMRDIRTISKWDYIKNPAAIGSYSTKANRADYDAKAAYCTRCGRNGHLLSDCKAKWCICGVILADSPGHGVRDATHDAARKNFVPKPRDGRDGKFDKKSSKEGGDRNLSRSNPKQQQSQQSKGEKKLDRQLKENDRVSAKMAVLMSEGKALVARNKMLTALINNSEDVSLIKATALVPYVPPSSSSRSARKRRRGGGRGNGGDSESE